jgi:hypothetical protein
VVAVEINAEATALRNPPVDDADEIAAALGHRGECHLPAERRVRLVQGDSVSAFGEDASGFETCRPAADDDAAPRCGRPAELPRQHQLPAGRRVVDAHRRAGRVDAVEADTGTDARTDPVGVPGCCLHRKVRVGDERPRHPDHVDQAFRHRVSRGRHVGDPRRVHDRDIQLPAHPSGELQVWARGRSHGRDDLRQLGIGVGPAADDADEVDAGAGERGRHANRFVGFDAVARRPLLVERHPHADDEVVADSGPDGGDDLEREPQPILQGAAVLVRAVVPGRRQELVEQVPAVGRDLDAVQAACLAARSGLGEVPCDPFQVVGIGDPGEGAVGGLSAPAGRQCGEPVVRVVGRAVAHVRELGHDGGTLLVDVVAEALEVRDGVVAVQLQVAESGRGVRADERAATHHGQRDPAASLLAVIGPIAVLGQSVLAVGRLVRSADDPVAQDERLQGERLEQRIVHSDAPLFEAARTPVEPAQQSVRRSGAGPVYARERHKADDLSQK